MEYILNTKTCKEYIDIIIDQCLETNDEMKDFYMEYGLSGHELSSLILYAPISLERKWELLSLLSKPKQEYIKELKKELDFIKTRLKHQMKLYEGAPSEDGYWYDYETKFINEFQSKEECLSYARKYQGDRIFTIVKGKHKYIVIKGDIVYYPHLGNDMDLNLPIPFKPGEIVEIDCSPFHKKILTMIMWNNSDYDCCGVGVLYRSESGYDMCALKHHHCIGETPLSPIYRLKRWNGKLPEEYEFFKVIQDEIKDMKQEEIEEYVRERMKVDNRHR